MELILATELFVNFYKLHPDTLSILVYIKPIRQLAATETTTKLSNARPSTNKDKTQGDAN